MTAKLLDETTGGRRAGSEKLPRHHAPSLELQDGRVPVRRRCRVAEAHARCSRASTTPTQQQPSSTAGGGHHRPDVVSETPCEPACRLRQGPVRLQGSVGRLARPHRQTLSPRPTPRGASAASCERAPGRRRAPSWRAVIRSCATESSGAKWATSRLGRAAGRHSVPFCSQGRAGFVDCVISGTRINISLNGF